jgi:hypothetical protein
MEIRLSPHREWDAMNMNATKTNTGLTFSPSVRGVFSFVLLLALPPEDL